MFHVMNDSKEFQWIDKSIQELLNSALTDEESDVDQLKNEII